MASAERASLTFVLALPGCSSSAEDGSALRELMHRCVRVTIELSSLLLSGLTQPHNESHQVLVSGFEPLALL